MDNKKLVIAASVALGLSTSAIASSGANPFQSDPLQSGYAGMQLTDKGGDGKCGAGKCGDKMKDKDNEKNKDKDNNQDSEQDKEGKKADGKCGAGKCGGNN